MEWYVESRAIDPGGGCGCGAGYCAKNSTCVVKVTQCGININL